MFGGNDYSSLWVWHRLSLELWGGEEDNRSRSQLVEMLSQHNGVWQYPRRSINPIVEQYLLEVDVSGSIGTINNSDEDEDQNSTRASLSAVDFYKLNRSSPFTQQINTRGWRRVLGQRWARRPRTRSPGIPAHWHRRVRQLCHHQIHRDASILHQLG